MVIGGELVKVTDTVVPVLAYAAARIEALDIQAKLQPELRVCHEAIEVVAPNGATERSMPNLNIYPREMRAKLGTDDLGEHG